MKAIFWFSAAFLLFTYGGYPIGVYFAARVRARPVRKAPNLASVTLVLAARNEEKNIERKLRNLALLDYPERRLDLIVFSDGSTDRTNSILTASENPRLRRLILPEHQGKAAALNQAVSQARGEIVVFTDARQTIARDALKNLVANFADPAVGCVSGQLMLGSRCGSNNHGGIGLYWEVEKRIRYWESLSGSTIGATGALFAIRRDLFLPLPQGTILDDVYIPIHIARLGCRVVFEPGAVVWDEPAATLQHEFQRKVRTLAGNYQLLRLAPWVLSGSNPLCFRFVCHKLLRLVAPLILLMLFVSAFWIRTGWYELALGGQILFYMLAGLQPVTVRVGWLARIASIPLAFVVLNAAAVMAFLYAISGRKVAWTHQVT
jgi:cellulose synthase/poly-beta-1,6-N-acetylglucosamine synthase-like glycosyltransferase